jgi:hypothetical protein
VSLMVVRHDLIADHECLCCLMLVQRVTTLGLASFLVLGFGGAQQNLSLVFSLP